MKKTLLTILLLFGFNAAHSLTLSDLRTEIRRAMRDTAVSGNRYSDAFLNDFINDAQREVVAVTWAVEKSTTITTITTAVYYPLPDDFLNVNNIYFTDTDGVRSILNQTTRIKIWRESPGWIFDFGKPEDYWIRQDINVPQLQIAIHPKPDNASTGTLTIQYMAIADDLTLDADTPFEDRKHLFPYHMSLAYHVIMRLKIIEGKPDEATIYGTFYSNILSIMAQKLGVNTNYLPNATGFSSNRTGRSRRN